MTGDASPHSSHAIYSHGHHGSVLRSHRWRTAANSAAHLLPHLRPGMSLLDVGAGPGTITMDLAEAVAPGRVTAVEASADVLELTRAEAETRHVTNVDFLVGDIQALELADDSFDVVHTHQVLHHVADQVEALREMRRVCAPGGIVSARETDFGAYAWFPESEGLDRWLSTFRALMRGNGGEPDAGRRLLSWAREAGFAEVTASSSTWCFATPEDRAWWGGSWAERVRGSAFAEQVVEAGLGEQADLDAMADAFSTWAGDDGGWFSVLHGEVLCRG